MDQQIFNNANALDNVAKKRCASITFCESQIIISSTFTDYVIKRCSEIEKFYASTPRSCGTLVIFSR